VVSPEGLQSLVADLSAQERRRSCLHAVLLLLGGLPDIGPPAAASGASTSAGGSAGCRNMEQVPAWAMGAEQQLHSSCLEAAVLCHQLLGSGVFELLQGWEPSSQQQHSQQQDLQLAPALAKLCMAGLLAPGCLGLRPADGD
jgi:hypothetical protein